MGTLRVDANLGSVLCNASLGCAYGYFHSIINYAGHQGPDGRLREEIKVSAHVRIPPCGSPRHQRNTPYCLTPYAHTIRDKRRSGLALGSST